MWQAYLKCYCADCAVGCGNKIDSEPEFCAEYINNERKLLALTVLVAVGPAAINQGLKIILKILVRFEKKHTKNLRDASLARNIFLAQFINTGLITLLVNADLVYYVSALEPLGPDPGLGFLAGEFRDLTSRWYLVVGATFIPAVSWISTDVLFSGIL